MRKTLITLISLAFFLTACTEREKAWNNYYQQEKELSSLEKNLIYANSQVKTICAIANTISGDYIEKVERVYETSGKREGGIRIYFHSGNSIVIYNGETGDNSTVAGPAGTDGTAPTLGIKQSGDMWYWTANGSFITDTQGNYLRANPIDASYGTEPKLTISDGNWYFQYTDPSGSSQSVLIGASASTEQRYFIKSFTIDENGEYVRIIFADGTMIDVPAYNSTRARQTVCDEINKNMDAFRTSLLQQEAGGYVVENIPLLDCDGNRGYELIFNGGESVIARKALSDEYTSQLNAPLVSAEISGGEWCWTVNGEMLSSAMVKGELPAVSYSGGKWYWKDAASTLEIQASTTYKSAVIDDVVFERTRIVISVTNSSSEIILDRASLDQVKSISIIPDAAGGAISVSSKTNYLTLSVKPSSAAASVAQSKVAKYFFDLRYYDSESKVDTTSVELKYSSWDSSAGTVTYSYSGKAIDPSFFSGMLSARASFRLIDGERLISTDYIKMEVGTGAVDLSKNGTANCYVVDDAGLYLFKAVSEAKIAEVLWESFGTDETPSVGSLIEQASYENGYVTFRTPDELKNGNAVIAVKDASGTILWSWHIWLCKDFDADALSQEYNNKAGRMMDRNLGATSATPGDVHALGLLYQWGRKDPFLGSSDINKTIMASSTINWPAPVNSDANCGTIDFAVSNPTTFIRWNILNNDWLYSGSDVVDDTRWSNTSYNKNIYDPCPAGWRVPDGGENGVWATALGSAESKKDAQWSDTYQGLELGKDSKYPLSNSVAVWYPSTGFRGSQGEFADVDNRTYLWSCNARRFEIFKDGSLKVAGSGARVEGHSVRCVSESSSKIVSVQKVELDKTSLEIPLDFPVQLKATVLPSNANVKAVVWSSDNTSIAEVDQNGNILTKKVGNCTISATSTVNKSAVGRCRVTVFDPGDLSASGTANSYIVTMPATYRINTKYKGNSKTEKIDNAASAAVLWESYGSDTKPQAGSLVSNLQFKNDSVFFMVPSPMKEGNAVIAVKDASGNVLWSWHIWLCKDYYPSSSSIKYYNGAGGFMDRNLGALTAKTGVYTDIGLLYQWGRKDPFPGSSSFVSARKAASTPDLPSAVSSDVSTGTVEYAVAHPMTFITSASDWCNNSQQQRWQDGDKGLYDPCPPGWKLPSGGVEGCWTIARGWPGEWNDGLWNDAYIGMSLQGRVSDSESWYPAGGFMHGHDASISGVGESSRLWTSTSGTDNNRKNYSVIDRGTYNTDSESQASNAYSVRCVADDGTRIIPLTSLKFSKNPLTIDKGQSVDVKNMIVCEPSNANLKAVKYSSDDTEVSVSEDGVVTAVKKGWCLVDAIAYNGTKAQLAIQVNVPVTGVSLDKTSYRTIENTSFKLTATISPSDASKTDLEWSSDNEDVAVVDQNGNVNCKVRGTATITVKTADGGFTAKCAVSVLLDGKDGNHEGAGTEDWGI